MGDATSTGVTRFLLTVSIIWIGCSLQVANAELLNPLDQVLYLCEQPLIMNMSLSRELVVKVTFNKFAIPAHTDRVGITFMAHTISPQFNILSLNDGETVRFTVPKRHLEDTKYQLLVTIRLHANYIGHAILQPTHVEFANTTRREETTVSYVTPKLPITIVQFEGVWGVVFIISVSVLIITSYINIGAQLDEDNMRLVIKRPKALILGSIISVVVMPATAWFVGIWFFHGQPLFRIGSFIFASSPAASASTLWTVMLNSDKELSVGLQVISTLVALITMPLLLYMMERSLDFDIEMSHHIRVPYPRLIQTLFVLLVALLVGWRLGRHKRAREISRKIFKPLVFFVLIFIIVFSSILYWHIYQMFDWRITTATFIITMATYITSGLFGLSIDCDLDRAVAISITSTYKNSGIAFAVLLIAFEAPDTYIAYVPCLTQVVTTSLTLYLTYIIVTLVNRLRRKGQPDIIQAISNEPSAAVDATAGSAEGEKSTKEDENDEFIVMNVVDIEPDSLPSSSSHKPQESNARTDQNGNGG